MKKKLRTEMYTDKLFIVKLFFCILFTSGMSFPIHAQKDKKKYNKNTQNFLRISVSIDDLLDTDTLCVRIFGYYYPIEEKLPSLYSKVSRDRDRIFHFNIPVDNDFGYFEIGKVVVDSNVNSVMNLEGLIYDQYWEKGDDINLTLLKTKGKKGYRCIFSGHGSDKYIAKQQADSSFRRAGLNDKKVFDEGYTYNDLFKYRIERAIKTLDANKNRISKSAYNTLKADYLFEHSYFRFYKIQEFFKKNILDSSSAVREAFIKSVAQQINEMKFSGIPDQYLARSKEYSDFVIRASQTLLYLKCGNWTGISQDSIYYFIKRGYQGILREKLITYFFLTAEIPEHFDAICREAIQLIKIPRFHEKVEELFDKISPRSTAYNFILPDTSGKLYALSEFRGKIVLIDFWFNGCGGCSYVYKNVLSSIEALYQNDTNIVFVSISADRYKSRWKEGILSGQYTGTKSINLYTNGEGYTHSLISFYHIEAYPTLLLLDNDGRVVKFNTHDLYDKRTLAESISNILEKRIQKNQIVGKN